jgi:small subunit ribosomal protein S1
MDDDRPIDPDRTTDETPGAAEDDEPEESFAELFESYTSGMSEDIRVGDKISGKIIAISDNAVFVDTGTKADGVVDLTELQDEAGELPYAVGDTLELFVVAASESEVRLSKAIAGIGGLSMLQDAFRNKIPVEGKVIQTIKGGFQVEVLQRRAFCPLSQIDTQYVENTEQYIGQTLQFRITELAERGRNIVVSRRDLLEAEQEQTRQEFIKTLAEDQVLSGRVTHLMPYGAFVELIPGLEGMVHISELSWSRLDKPEEAVSPGDKIEVKILSIDNGDKRMKIALSAKQVTGDPWERVADEIESGQKITGKVTRCAPFGAFIEIRPGIEGLVHISEMSYTRRVMNPEEIVQPGQTISVLIKEIDVLKRRIGLSIRDAEGDPWLDVTERFTVGQPVSGTVEKLEKFGIFVTLSPGIVGLLPKSVISRSSKTAQIDKLKQGDTISVVVSTIQAAERKISLSLGDSDDESNWRQFAEKSTSSTTSLGALGDKLAEALKKSKK